MQRVCFLLRIKPEHREEYLARHEDVWPEMLAALRETGWRNYTLFIADDGLVVGYLETDDFDASVRAMAATEVNARWQAKMTPFFDLRGRAPDEGFVLLDEYFHLD
jgi:L-rhamnose mutarotase